MSKKQKDDVKWLFCTIFLRHTFKFLIAEHTLPGLQPASKKRQ